MTTVFLLLCLATTTEAAGRHANLRQFHESVLKREHPLDASLLASVETGWFQQTINHDSPFDDRQYQQRYYVNDQYYKPGGPAFLYIGGEGALGPSCVASGEIVETAKAHNGLLFGLEHRYYGLSQPFPDWRTENLLYLSSPAALTDAAKFVDLMGQKYSPPNESLQWFTFGGSYPGSLSAWFRLKFPHLTSGSLASSAPVLAKADFYEYDQAVSASVTGHSPTCAADIRSATHEVEAALDANPASVLASFGCSQLSSPTEFLYVLADAVAYSVQYTTNSAGPRYHLLENMCATLGDHSRSGVDQFRVFVAQLFSALSTNCYDFTTTLAILQNTTVDEGANQRQWYYQSCTEFGYFQTAPPSDSLRSTRIDLQFHLQQCQEAYGFPLVPDVPKTNAYYGGNNTHGSRICFSNGSLDPWHVLSITEPLECCPDQPAILIEGTSHCADLYAASSSDPASLTAARVQIQSYISKWLQMPH